MGDDCNLGDAHRSASTRQRKEEKAGARAPGNSLPGSGYPPLSDRVTASDRWSSSDPHQRSHAIRPEMPLVTERQYALKTQVQLEHQAQTQVDQIAAPIPIGTKKHRRTPSMLTCQPQEPKVVAAHGSVASRRSPSQPRGIVKMSQGGQADRCDRRAPAN